MPRNSAGVYTLPDPPVVANTVIDPVDENITRDDIALELTNSLDRSGRGGMLAPFRIADGIVAQPGLGFLLDPDNGMYRIGTDNWAFAAGGVKVAEMIPTQFIIPAGITFNALGPVSITGQGLFADGTLAAPGISWLNEPTAGFYRSAVNTFHFAIGGGNTFSLQPSGITLGSGVNLVVASGQIRAATGSVALPGYAFLGEASTGMAFLSPGTIGFSLSGVASVIFQPSGVTLGGVLNLTMGGTMNAASAVIGAAGGISFKGANPTTWGPAQLFATNSAGVPISIYTWTAFTASSEGSHVFRAIAGGNSFGIFAPGYNAGGVGATIEAFKGSDNIGGIDMTAVSGGSGTFNADMRFSIARGGAFVTTGDMILRRLPGGSAAQLEIKGGATSTAQPINHTLVANGSPGGIGGLGLVSLNGSNAIISSSNVFYFYSTLLNGPISGFSMYIDSVGTVGAAAFVPTSDEALKTNITPITNALASLLQLQGVKYTQTWDSKPSMGLLAQNLLPVYPELVHINTPPEGAPVAGINYMALMGPMIEALREIDARLTALGG